MESGLHFTRNLSHPAYVIKATGMWVVCCLLDYATTMYYEFDDEIQRPFEPKSTDLKLLLQKPPTARIWNINMETDSEIAREDTVVETLDDHFMQTGKLKFAGRHYILDFWGVSGLTDRKKIEQAMTEAAHIAGAIVLHVHLHRFAEGGGITGVALLAESHISVHTWPEHHYAAFDIFMCGNAMPEKSVKLLKEVFQPSRVEIQEILRGRLTNK